MFHRNKKIFKKGSGDFAPSDDLYVAPEDLLDETGTVSEAHPIAKHKDDAAGDTADLILEELKTRAGVSDIKYADAQPEAAQPVQEYRAASPIRDDFEEDGVLPDEPEASADIAEEALEAAVREPEKAKEKPEFEFQLEPEPQKEEPKSEAEQAEEKVNLGFKPVNSLPQYEGRFAHVGELTRTRNSHDAAAHEPEHEPEPEKSKVEEEINDEAEPEVVTVVREPLEATDYDDLINWKSRLAHEAPLFNRAFSMANARTVVEAGSGTGKHSEMFAEWGLHVTGIESSDDLIERARSFSELKHDEIEQGRGDLRFIHGNLGSISRSLGYEKVDALVCVDDNLLRCGSLSNLRVVLADFADCLVTGGILVLGFSNYARLTQGKTRSTKPEVFDTVEGTKVFFRVLDYPAGSSVVDIDQLSLTRAEDGAWSTESVHVQDLYVSSTGISRELIDAGFDVLELSGDYNGKEYKQFEDDKIVIIARRKRHRSSLSGDRI